MRYEYKMRQIGIDELKSFFNSLNLRTLYKINFPKMSTNISTQIYY